jgi:pimeloyl-ACP methyl ester carboxylesterase
VIKLKPSHGAHSPGRRVSATGRDTEWQAVDWSAHIHDAKIRGRRVRYVDIGRGPAVVLLHGQGGSWQWWLRILPALASRHRIIAVDLAGFGGSDVIASGDVFHEHVATIVGLLKHLGLAKSIIVGHSMGGLISLQLACEHPAYVSGLLLSNAGGANIGRLRLRFIVAGMRVFNAIFAMPGVPQAVARRRWLRAAVTFAAINDHRALSEAFAVETIPRMPAPGSIQSLHAAAEAVNRVTPQDVNCPTLIIWGTRDRILPLSTGQALASMIPDARFVPLAGVGHCPMVEAPDLFSELVIDFARDPQNGRPHGEEKPA